LVFVLLLAGQVHVAFALEFRVDHAEGLLADDQAVLQLWQVGFSVVYDEFVLNTVLGCKFDEGLVLEDLETDLGCAC
jgi:hypothetical protein